LRVGDGLARVLLGFYGQVKAMASRRPRRCRGKTPGGDQQRPPVERCPAAEVGAGRRADGRSGGEAVGAHLVAEEDQPRGRAVELTEHGAGAGAADELEPPPVDEHGIVRPGAKEGVLDELCGGWPARLGGEMWSGDGERNLDACAAAQRPPPPTPALALSSFLKFIFQAHDIQCIK